MLAQDPPLGGDHDPLRVDPHAHRPVGERGRHTVAVALELHEAGRRYTLGVLDEAVERTTQRHQAGDLLGLRVGDRAGQDAMLDLAPLLDAALLEPGVERVQIGEAGQRLPQPATRILHVLLDLALLPTRGGVTELGLEQVMAGHRREPGVDLSRLARPDAIDRGLHVVEDTASRHSAQHPERLGQRVEQHLVGLERIGSHDERSAVRELGVRRLQLGPLAAEHGPVLAPVELEGLARREDQGNERAAAAGLGIALTVGLPGPHEDGNAPKGAAIAQGHQIGVHLLRRALLLARLAGLDLQPPRQLLRERIQLARPLGNLDLRLHRPGAQVLADRVARQARAPLDLPDRHILPEMPAPDYTQ